MNPGLICPWRKMLRIHGRSTPANRGESFRFPKLADSITDMNAEPGNGFPDLGIRARADSSFNRLVVGKFVNQPLLTMRHRNFVRFPTAQSPVKIFAVLF